MIMKKYTNPERPQSFVPLGSDYKRFVAMQEAKRIKRIPEVGAQLPTRKPLPTVGERRVGIKEESPELKRLQERMQKSLGSENPKPATDARKPQAIPAEKPETNEIDIFKKLHGTTFDPNSKRDRGLLGYIKSAAEEAGGYGDFKAIRNLAYSQQYGPESSYGKMAKSWRQKQK